MILRDERPPVDPGDVESDPSGWPAWTDNWYREIGPGPPPAMTAEERAEFEAWLASLEDPSGDIPPSRPVGPPPDRLSVEELAKTAVIVSQSR